jgi:N-acetylneuraminic acid mutarotase
MKRLSVAIVTMLLSGLVLLVSLHAQQEDRARRSETAYARLIIWGGLGSNMEGFSDGAIYDIKARKWEKIPEAPIDKRGLKKMKKDRVVDKVLKSRMIFRIKGYLSQGIGGNCALAGSEAGRPKLVTWGGIRVKSKIFKGSNIEGQIRGLKDGAVYDINTGEWKKLPKAPIKGRYGHTFIISGAKLIIWGGNVGKSVFSDGAIYDLRKESWKELKAPIAARCGHSSILYNKKLIIWGGTGGGGIDGAIYNIETDEWSEIIAPIKGRARHKAAVIGSNKMVILGGRSERFPGQPAYAAFLDGGIYDIEEDEWEEIPTAPLDVRQENSIAISDAKLIFWGGRHKEIVFPDGAIYDIKMKKWKELPDAPIRGRYNHKSVLYGTKLVIWGGRGARGPFSDGAIYDIKTGKWERLPEAPIEGRSHHTFILSGTKLIIWGGRGKNGPLSDGAIYDLKTNKWEKLPEAPIKGRYWHASFILRETNE